MCRNIFNTYLLVKHNTNSFKIFPKQRALAMRKKHRNWHQRTWIAGSSFLSVRFSIMKIEAISLWYTLHRDWMRVDGWTCCKFRLSMQISRLTIITTSFYPFLQELYWSWLLPMYDLNFNNNSSPELITISLKIFQKHPLLSPTLHFIHSFIHGTSVLH